MIQSTIKSPKKMEDCTFTQLNVTAQFKIDQTKKENPHRIFNQ